MKSATSFLPPVSERIRPGARERFCRTTEAVLLFLALLVLVAGSALALLAKLPPAGANGYLDINQATATQLAAVLKVSPQTGERLVAERSRADKSGFEDVDALARVTIDPKAKERHALVPYPNYAAVKAQLVIRTPDRVRHRYFVWVGALAGFFVLAHLVIRGVHPRADPYLLPICALLSFLSVLLLFALKDPLRDKQAFVAQAQGAIFGGAVALIAALSPLFGKLPLHRYGYLYALAAFGLCVILGVLGTGPGGAKLNVGGIQPIEIIKVLLVFFLAAYLAERAALLEDPLRQWGPIPIPRQKDALPLLVLYAMPLVLFAIIRDLGPILLLFGIFVILLYLATGRGIYIWAGVAFVVAIGVLGYKNNLGVAATRVDMWLHPWDNTHKLGDQLARGLWGIASGGPLGSGLGLGGTRYIPRGGSDLALASLGEDTGVAGPITVLICALAIVARGFAIARRAATDFDRYLAAGLSGLFGLQTLLITSGTLGLFPLTGVTLPFLSNGRSSLVVSFFVIGVLLHLSSRIPQGNSTLSTLPRVWNTTARRVGLFFFLTLGVICIGRLVFLQAIIPDLIATKIISVPDADKVKRPHVNPRLLTLASQITRGRILDRNGKLLAFTREDGRRVYPLGAAAGHLIGYLDPSIGGPTGLERRFNGQLRGYTTDASLLPYWRGKDMPGAKLPHSADVTLALDSDLQLAALDALKRETATLHDTRTGRPKQRGAAVLLDVATGGVLAAVTLPNYDPNTLTPSLMRYLNANLDHDSPLINRAVAGYYPPGSTFKIVTASAQFAANQADFTYDCRHVDNNVIWTADGKTYARRQIVDDEGDRAHGLTNISEAIVQSCNIYFAHAALQLGPEALRSHAEKYGFMHLPTPAQFDAALPDIAYGQGEMLASPIEMADVALTVADGGQRPIPQWEKHAAPKIADAPLTRENAQKIADMLRRVTISGTAANRFDDLPFTVAGKTGTAQNGGYDKAPHSWFVGFAPADKPKVAFAIVVENGGYGAQTAVPIAHTILSKIKP